MIGRLLDRLDAFGLDDPDANEGQIEDRCPVCEWPMIDHTRYGYDGLTPIRPRAKWPHRRAAAVAIAFGCP